MASGMTVNLLDDGVVDTLVSVGATSGVHTDVSIDGSNCTHRYPIEKLVNKACDARR
jgi:hypothetical protein